jgi:hypothetical protein
MIITKAVLPDGFSVRRRLQTYTPSAAGGVYKINTRRAYMPAPFFCGMQIKQRFSVVRET